MPIFGWTPPRWDLPTLGNFFAPKKEKDDNQYKPPAMPTGPKLDVYGKQFGPQNLQRPGLPYTTPLQQLGPSAQQMQQSPQVTNAFEQLMQQLMSLSQQGGYSGPSLAEMQNRSESMANAQYGPQIQALQRNMEAARGRAAVSRDELGQLYQALSTEMYGQMPGVEQTYTNAMNTSKANEADLMSRLSQDYAARQQEIQNQAAALGQQAAGQQEMNDIAQDQSFIQGLQQTNAQAALNNLLQQQSGNVEYTRKQGELASQEGTNRQADIGTELEQYLRQQEMGITDIESQRAAAVQAMMMQQQMQAEEMRAQASQQQWQRMMDIIGVRMQGDQMQAKLNAPAEGPSFGDMISGQRLEFDQQKQLFDQIMAIAKATDMDPKEVMAMLSQNGMLSGMQIPQ